MTGTLRKWGLNTHPFPKKWAPTLYEREYPTEQSLDLAIFPNPTFFSLLALVAEDCLSSASCRRPRAAIPGLCVCVEAQCNLFWLAFLLAPTIRFASRKRAERGSKMSV